MNLFWKFILSGISKASKIFYFTKTARTCRENKKKMKVILEVQIERFLFAHTAIIKVFSSKVKCH